MKCVFNANKFHKAVTGRIKNYKICINLGIERLNIEMSFVEKYLVLFMSKTHIHYCHIPKLYYFLGKKDIFIMFNSVVKCILALTKTCLNKNTI